jgi:flotillin
MRKQNAEREVGEKEAEKEKLVGIAVQVSMQEVQTQAKITREKEMEVKQVEQVKQAEINKEQALIDAEKEKQLKIISAEALKVEQERKAEADLITQTKNAEGKLVEMTKNAAGIKAEGLSKADAEKLMQVAMVSGAIELAAKIAQSPEYMEYLQNIESIKASQNIGTANAEALKSADLKILANGGSVDKGMTSLLDVFSGKGGAAMASMLENLNNSDLGKNLIGKFLTPKKEDKRSEAELKAE